MRQSKKRVLSTLQLKDLLISVLASNPSPIFPQVSEIYLKIHKIGGLDQEDGNRQQIKE